MKIIVDIVHAFVKNNQGGNPAGVVINSYNLTDEQMLSVARKLGYSETAFIHPSNIADYNIRYFTPSKEIDLCGHATIATFSILNSAGHVKEGTYTLETKAGLQEVEIKKNIVFMSQNPPEYYARIESNELLDCLNVEEKVLGELPIQIVSTGLRDIIVPIKDLASLYTIQPNFDKIKQISKKYDAVGIHAFTMDTVEKHSTAHSRNFAPLYGIEEESATGTASGALSSYLYTYHQVNHKSYQDIILEQGYVMGKPSEIQVKLNVNQNKVIGVKVGGSAVKVFEKELTI